MVSDPIVLHGGRRRRETCRFMAYPLSTPASERGDAETQPRYAPVTNPTGHNMLESTPIVVRIAKLSLLAYCLLALPARADGPTVEDISRRMVRADAFSWDGAKARIRMVLTDKDGTRKEKTMDVLGRRSDGLLQTMIRFVAPANVAGTAFLMLERSGKSAEQYVYLSGLKRTRRIVGREQESSFMGSDFSYSDMQGVYENHAKSERLADDHVGTTPTFVVNTTIDKGAPVPYSKIVTWVRKSDYVAIRTRFYDRAGKPLKTLYVRKIDTLEGKPVVVQARMENQQTGHSTDLYVNGIERKDDLPAVAFTPSALEHY